MTAVTERIWARQVLPRSSRQTGGTHGPRTPLLVLFGFDFEVFNHFAEESHREEATLIVLGDQPNAEKLLLAGRSKITPPQALS